MKRFTFKNVLDGFRSSVTQPARVEQEIVETLRQVDFQAAKVVKRVYPKMAPYFAVVYYLRVNLTISREYIYVCCVYFLFSYGTVYLQYLCVCQTLTTQLSTLLLKPAMLSPLSVY